MSKSAIPLDILFSSIENSAENHTTSIPQKKEYTSTDIAVIGMACQTADAHTPEQLWNNIYRGKNSIQKLSNKRKKRLRALAYEGVFNPEIFKAGEKKNSTAMPHLGKKAYLENIDFFDPAFFNINAKDARLMDPFQRKWMETAYNALEDAGYGGIRLKGSNTGIFTGSSKDMSLEYGRFIEFFEPEAISQSALGNLNSAIPGRLSHFMDFRGPAIHVDTACSSSLIAVHLACQSIINDDCDIAVAGGCRIRVIPFTPKHAFGIESASETTRPFDIDADGTCEGEGVGVVILKSLKEAIRDGDYIYGVIKSSAITQDGKGAGLGVPNGESQKEAILKAWKKGKIDPETITYIEAHGTATKIGDPIEVEAIASAFRNYTNKKQFCAVGSIKANIGHLYEAAGIFGLIKTIKALEKKRIPPNIHFNIPNPSIPFEDTALYVPVIGEEWKNSPRRCGVNCFGISGTNCHMVLEEYTSSENSREEDLLHLFTLSAKEEKVLNHWIELHLNVLDKKMNLGNMCYTLNRGRGDYEFRIAFLVKDINDLKEKLTYIKNTPGSIHNPPELSSEEEKELMSKVKGILKSIGENNYRQEDMEALVNIYLAGGEINWNKFYQYKNFQSIPLPPYPYNSKPYWIETPICVDLNEHPFYNLKWEPKPLPKTGITKKQLSILFSPSSPGEKIIDLMKKAGYDVIEGKIEGARGDQDVIYNSAMKKSLENLGAKDFFDSSRKILNLLPLTLKNETSLYFISDLSRIIKENFPGENFKIINITEKAYSIDGEDFNPIGRMVFAFSRTLSLEEPNIQTRSIDINFSQIGGLECLLQQDIKKNYYSILRHEKVYTPVFDLEDPDEWKDNEIRISPDGAYIITGGMGGLGLVMARILSLKEKVNIILVSRGQTLPEEAHDKILNKIKQGGANVLIEKGDVIDRESIKKVISMAKKKFGRINGIIHAAGLIEDMPLARKTHEQFWKVLAPKVRGTLNLHQLTENDPPDFFILFSSLSAVFNNVYQADYSAANSFLDGFSQWRNRRGMKTISINWPGWKETGMAKRVGFTRDAIFRSMPTAQAMELFDVILKKSPVNVIPGIINLDVDYETFLPNYGYTFSRRLQYQWDIEKNKEKTKNTFRENKKIVLIGRTDNRYTEAEKKLGSIMGDTFGLDKIDINSDFYDLGGDSLTAISIYYQLPDIFSLKSQINIEEFVQAGTIKNIAALIEANI